MSERVRGVSLREQHYGQTSGQTWRTGDFDGNDTVDFADLVVLAQNYETTSGVADSSFGADWALALSLVPEPTCLASLAVSLGALCRRRSR